jgi:hypothetical protein
VHKVQLKPKKKFSWGLNLIWSKGLESVLQMAHRTVSGVPGQAALKPATLGFLWGALRYNLSNCPVSQQSNDYLAPTVNYKGEQL